MDAKAALLTALTAVALAVGAASPGTAQQESGSEDGSTKQADSSEQASQPNQPAAKKAKQGQRGSASSKKGKAAGDAGEAKGGESTDQPSAERVLQRMLQQRRENPLIEPRGGAEGGEAEAPYPSQAPAGTAPNAGDAPLRPEGQFILTRKGRMMRAPGEASAWMFVFSSDASGKELKQPPMFLMPCQLLEEMEKLRRDRGKNVEFVLSGQIFQYRGANYLLPTLMKLSADRGNLDS